VQGGDEFEWCPRTCPDPDEHSDECCALQDEARRAARYERDYDSERADLLADAAMDAALGVG
jgi:hypothetical protein